MRALWSPPTLRLGGILPAIVVDYWRFRQITKRSSVYVYLLGNILSRTRICGNYSGLNNSATHNVQRNSDNNDNRDKQHYKNKNFYLDGNYWFIFTVFTGTLLKVQNKELLERRSASAKFKNRHTSDVLTSAEKLVCPARGCCLSKVDLIPGNKTFGDNTIKKKRRLTTLGFLPFFAPLWSPTSPFCGVDLWIRRYLKEEILLHILVKVLWITCHHRFC